MIVLDSHCDAPLQMLKGRDYGQDNEGAQVDFPKLKRGGVNASFFALYIPATLQGRDATDHAYRLLAETRRQVAANAGTAAFAANAAEVRENASKGLISVLLGLENGSALQEDFSILHDLYSQGVRYVTLTHSRDNQICDSCTGSGTWGGLSPFGRKLVAEMNRTRMLIDVAHCSDATVRDCLELSEKPVVCTHGCCRALASHKRNLPDELLAGIARKGGVVGMSIFPCFLSDAYCSELEASGLGEDQWEEMMRLPSLPGIPEVVSHITHAVEVCGASHVGIGTDYDGIEVTPRGMETVADFGRLPEALLSSGFSDADVRGIMGENFLKLLEK